MIRPGPSPHGRRCSLSQSGRIGVVNAKLDQPEMPLIIWRGHRHSQCRAACCSPDVRGGAMRQATAAVYYAPPQCSLPFMRTTNSAKSMQPSPLASASRMIWSITASGTCTRKDMPESWDPRASPCGAPKTQNLHTQITSKKIEQRSYSTVTDSPMFSAIACSSSASMAPLPSLSSNCGHKNYVGRGGASVRRG